MTTPNYRGALINMLKCLEAHAVQTSRVKDGNLWAQTGKQNFLLTPQKLLCQKSHPIYLKPWGQSTLPNERLYWRYAFRAYLTLLSIYKTNKHTCARPERNNLPHKILLKITNYTITDIIKHLYYMYYMQNMHMQRIDVGFFSGLFYLLKWDI